MSPAPRPWKARTPAERVEAVRPLEAEGQAPSTIAWRLKAPQPDIARICSLIRREREARGDEQASPVLAEPADAVVAAGNVLREPAATVPGQNIREGDAPRETDCQAGEQSQGGSDASCPDAEHQGKPLRPVDGPEAHSRDRASLPADSRAGDRRLWAELSPREKDAAVLPLARQGLTTRAIAGKLGVNSRNSIITVVARLRKAEKLPPARKAQSARTRRSTKTKATEKKSPSAFKLFDWTDRVPTHPNDFKARAEQRAASPGITISRAAAFDPLPGVEPIGIMDLGATTCRWPLEIEKPGHFYCGAPCEVERTYCDLHSELATTGQTLRRIRIPAHA